MSQRQRRAERRKNKLSAFLRIAKLNDIDREMRKTDEEEEMEVKTTSDDSAPLLKKFKREKFEEKEGIQGTVYEEASLRELRKAARGRQKLWKRQPSFKLKEAGQMASLSVPDDKRVPLFMIDIQHLILYSLLGHHAPFDAPRWYQLLKFNKLSHTTVVVIEDMSVEELFDANNLLKQEFCELFSWQLEMVGPSTYGSSLIQEMATIPLSNTQYDKIIKKFGNLEKALKGKAVYKVFRTMFPVTDKDNCDDAKEKKRNKKDEFSRTDLLLSAEQMLDMGYPLPLLKTPSSDSLKQPLAFSPIENCHPQQSLGELIQSDRFQKLQNERPTQDSDSEKTETFPSEQDKDDLYVLSRSWYKEVGPDSPLIALDCEMCMTGKNRFELTRISVVDEDLNVIYESYVKPRRKITNYLTRFSGITADHLKGVETSLCDVQKDLRNLLPPDAILVGQSLNFDLHALRIMHPYVIDTSVIFNLTGQRSKKTKLATLSRLFLSEEIQCWGAKGHDSVEDAAAAMKLVLLKLSRDISFGDAVMGHETGGERSPRQMRIANEIGTNNKMYATSIFSHVKRGEHNAVVISSKEFVSKYKDFAEEGLLAKLDVTKKGPNKPEERTVQVIEVEEAKEAVSRACQVMLEQQLCIVHLCRDDVGDKLKRLQKWCNKLLKAAAIHSLCIVIFGGAQTANGACLIHLKQPE